MQETWLQARKTERYASEKRFRKRIEAGRERESGFLHTTKRNQNFRPSMGRTVQHH